MEFKQKNKNAGNVNNAVSDQGNVVQSIGGKNTVKVNDKVSHVEWLLDKLKGLLSAVCAWFGWGNT
jgi:hypothetical protein